MSSRCSSPRHARKNSEGIEQFEENMGGRLAQWLPLKSHLPQKVTTQSEHAKQDPLCAIPSSRDQSPFGSSPISKQRENTSRKKKESLADLGLDLMTTVQECSMDSPTIPGHPPMMRKFKQGTQIPPVRSLPQPTQSQILKAAEEDCLSPYLVPRSVFSSPRGEKRASSVLLPKGLAPLVIPNSMMDFVPAQMYRSPLPSKDSEDLPPKVPPKSPNTLIRAFPHPRKARETPISAVSPFSAFHTANSSATSISTVDSRASPKPWTSPARGRSPLNTQNFSETSKEGSQELPIRKQSEPTLVDERSKAQSNQTQAEASNRGRHKTYLPGHQRAESEASILNRARPMRRGDTTLQRSLSRNLKLQDLAKLPTDELPQGMLMGTACEKLAACEIRKLKQLAELRIRDFRVLKEAEVSSLIRELRELDERCDYLQATHASLRDGRCDLHDRMVGILKSPRTATFSREHLIKQEEALFDLDISINEWLMKLNAAENRRQKVQRKLLEHTAAVIYMTGPPSPRDKDLTNEHTPPRSPQNPDFSPERRVVESIRIYAGSGVDLLASIEQEIDVLAESMRNEGY